MTDPWARRVSDADWVAIAAEIDDYGGAVLPQLLTPDEAADIRDLYAEPGLFRAFGIYVAFQVVVLAALRARLKGWIPNGKYLCRSR